MAKGVDVNPEDLDKASKKMRLMGVRDQHASEDYERALTERAGDDDVFGASAQGRALAEKWDHVVRKRVRRTKDLSLRTLKMADDLSRAADMYRTTERSHEDKLRGYHEELARLA